MNAKVTFGYPMTVGSGVLILTDEILSANLNYSPITVGEGYPLYGEIVNISKTGVSIKVKFANGDIIPFRYNQKLGVYHTDKLDSLPIGYNIKTAVAIKAEEQWSKLNPLERCPSGLDLSTKTIRDIEEELTARLSEMGYATR